MTIAQKLKLLIDTVPLINTAITNKDGYQHDYAGVEGLSGEIDKMFAGRNGLYIDVVNNEYVIHNDLTSIADNTFKNYSTSFRFDDSEDVVSIGAHAFDHAALLNTDFTTKTTSIGDYAFYYTNTPSTCTFDLSNCTSFGSYAFNNVGGSSASAKSISIILNDDVTEIPTYCFASAGIVDINIPSSLETIGNYAFSGVHADIILPDTVTDMGTSTMYGITCSHVKFPRSLSIIPDSTLWNSNVGTIDWPEDVVELGNSAMQSAMNASVVLPDTVEKLGQYAFSNCHNLTSFHIPENLKSVGLGAFRDCPNLLITSELPSGIEEVGVGAFVRNNWTSNPPSVSSIVSAAAFSGELDGSLRSVGNSAFANSTGTTLTGTIDPNCALSQYAFYGCSNLALSGSVPRTIPTYCFMECPKVAFSGEMPYNVGNYAFYNCQKLAFTELPSNYSSISVGTYGFYNCKNMVLTGDISSKYLNLSTGAFWSCEKIALTGTFNNSSSSGIPEYAFAYCYDLALSGSIKSSPGMRSFYYCKNVTFDSFDSGYYMKTIGNEAFYRCEKVTFDSLPSTLTSLGTGVFEYCTSITSFDLTNMPGTTVPTYTFYTCSSLDNVTFKSITTVIDSYAFAYTKLTQVTSLPDSITTINSNAFYNTQIPLTTLPASIKTIGSGAFYNSRVAITEVPSTVTSLETNAFNNSKVATVTYKPNIAIPQYAFYDCSLLTSFDVEGNVASVDAYAFCNCKALRTFIFRHTPTTINTSAFSGCTQATLTIYCPWSSGAVAGAPWGATNATIVYDFDPTTDMSSQMSPPAMLMMSSPMVKHIEDDRISEDHIPELPEPTIIYTREEVNED